MTNSQVHKEIILEGVFNKCDELPTKKLNFELLQKELIRKGYVVNTRVVETMESEERNEICVILADKKYKIFTNCDPYSKDAILDSNLYNHLNEAIIKIEEILN